MNDRVLGGLIFVGSVGLAVFYLWWLFLSPPAWQWWAIAVPILLGVVTFLFIVAWIGWTMAMTPAPTMIEEEAETKKGKRGKKKP